MMACWDGVPFWCRVVFCSSVGLYLGSFIVPQIASLLVCLPMDVLHGQVWRLFTGLIMHSSFIVLLFSVFSYIPTAMQIESDVGTVRYAYRFWVYGFLIYLLFTLFCGGLALAGQGRLVGQQVG